MSRLIGKELTKLLLDRLNGQNVTPHESKIIPIFTLDDLGWPHPALLSYFEVVAKNSSTVDLALWKDSSTANNLRRLGKVTLMITDKIGRASCRERGYSALVVGACELKWCGRHVA